MRNVRERKSLQTIKWRLQGKFEEKRKESGTQTGVTMEVAITVQSSPRNQENPGGFWVFPRISPR